MVLGGFDGARGVVGGLTVPLPAGVKAGDGHTAVFIRPHLLDLHPQEPAGGSFRARVVRVNPAGPLVKVELVTEWGDSARAELTQDRYRAAPVACGDDVFVSAREAVPAVA